MHKLFILKSLFKILESGRDQASTALQCWTTPADELWDLCSFFASPLSKPTNQEKPETTPWDLEVALVRLSSAVF